MKNFSLELRRDKKTDLNVYRNINKSVFFCSSKKGITLIALVISIIVILILTGIVLNATIGDNGIINKSQTAKFKQEVVDVETEILAGLSALDTEYYQKLTSDFGIDINDIYSISGLQKYVNGKVNGFNYNENGESIIYYTNSNGSYTVKVKNGKATTYAGIYLEANECININMDVEKGKNTVQLTTNMKDVVWVSLNQSIAIVDSATGKVEKILEGTVKIIGESTNGDKVYIIISDDNLTSEEQKELEETEIQLAISSGKKWEDDVADGFAGGDGSKENPYKIENAQQLAFFAKTVNNGESYEEKYIELTQNINLEYIPWTPIGLGIKESVSPTRAIVKLTNQFEGNFNGNGKTISKIYIEEEETSGVGLFGAVGELGVIENVNLKNGKVTGCEFVGGLVGYNVGDIKECSSNLEVIAVPITSWNSSGQEVGGIAGCVIAGNVENCSNTGKITAKYQADANNSGLFSGGIVGWIGIDGTIKNCNNSGEIIAENQASGGIVGKLQSGEVSNCINFGKIDTGNNYSSCDSGGIVGWQASGTVADCINSGKIISRKSSAGGIVGYIDTGKINNCKNLGSVNVSTYNAGGIAGGQKGTTIYKCENFGEVTAEVKYAGGIVGNLVKGEISECTNSGKINAEQFSIGGIVGLQNAGTISGCSNLGDITVGCNIIGGIVGYVKDGTITKCTNSGKVIAEIQTAGGITGIVSTAEISECSNFGTVIAKFQESDTEHSGLCSAGIVAIQNSGTITKCENSGEIITERNIAGGITGKSYGTVSKCVNIGKIKQLATMKIDGAAGYMSGGISGQNNGGTIEYCYNKGTVESSDIEDIFDEIGGIVGINFNNGIIKYCYNQGNLIGGDVNGGIVGQLYNGTLEKNYYYLENLEIAIGHNGTSFTQITIGSDISGKAEIIELSEANKIIDFNSFWNWIQSKI